jgi:pimeloyl-ACP methyl ester carboxylesterase
MTRMPDGHPRRLPARIRPAMLLGALLASWPSPLGAEPAASPVATSDFAGLIDIGDDRRIWLDCRGEGSPTVILEAGAGNNAEIWDTIALPAGVTDTAVLPGVTGLSRVCAYDRPNTFLDPEHPSRSDRVPNPRTAADMVADLHTLLTTADVAGPHVLVGHSFGGLIVRLFATVYPDAVAGLVLVDAAHEDYYASVQELLTPEQWALYDAAPENPNYPHLEKIDTQASATQMRDAALVSPLRPMPLVVLTHGRPWDWPEDFPAAALEDLWATLQDDLFALVPDARFVVAEQSGHYIQHDEPALVIEAIRQVVDAVRDPDTWSATPASQTLGQTNAPG